MIRSVLCSVGGWPGALVLDALLDTECVEVVGVVRSTRVLHRDRGPLSGTLAQVRTTGLRYAAYLAAMTHGADLLLRGSPVPPLGVRARRLGIPVFATRDINERAGIDFLNDLEPDLLVSAFFNQRIGEEAVRSARRAALNIHPSLLPDFKGVDPVFFMRLAGHAELGVTVHHIAPEFDTGDIVLRHPVPDRPGESVLRTTARLFRAGGRALARRLDEEPSKLPRHPQPQRGRYDSWPTPDRVAELIRAGHRLVRLDDLRLMRTGDPAWT